jgi:hypothetical protein
MGAMLGANLCEAGQVDQSEVQDVWGEYLEVNGLAIDAFVAPCDARGLVLDLALDIAKVVEPPVGDVMKLGPLIQGGLGRVPVAGLGVISGVLAGNVDQLQNEGSSSNDAAATGEEVSADDVLEYRGLARGLGTNNNLQCANIISAMEPKRGVAVAGVIVMHTIWGRSRESFPIVLKTRSCNLLTVPSKSSPSAAMATVVQSVRA